jgi:HPt (histidine-containing phosphotransfer) domain-containing protein
VPQDEKEPAGAKAEGARIGPIAGVDVPLGVSRIGGDARNYVEMLAAFVRDAEERLEKLDPADLKAFTTSVHALKSAAVNIGAPAVSALAAALETAGMANDEAAITGRLGEFVAALTALNANIRAALKKAQDAVTEPAVQTSPEAREILGELKDAIRALKIDAIDAALERLRHVPLDLHWREQIAAIANMVLLACFDEALAAAEALETEQKRVQGF